MSNWNKTIQSDAFKALSERPMTTTDPKLMRCQHESWEERGGYRKCCDCGQWLNEPTPPPTIEAAINEAVQNAGQWQDIATAPRDGTAILITRDTRFQSEEGWHVVRWDDDWWQVHCGKFDHPLRGPDPTHWMPLPSPPAIEAHKESGHG